MRMILYLPSLQLLQLKRIHRAGLAVHFSQSGAEILHWRGSCKLVKEAKTNGFPPSIMGGSTITGVG
jgi:hypothetical protein